MDVKVSVIISTYNRGSLIGETLDSVEAQTLSDWECIIVDDGSVDETEALVQRYTERDSRFKYVKRPADRPKGGNSCRNIGLELAKGTFIQFLDSNDLLAANKFEEQVRALSHSANDAVATCKWGRFRTSRDRLRAKANEPTYISSEGPLKLLNVFVKHSIWLPSHVYLTRKTTIDKAGNWNEDLKMNKDGEFFARVLLCASQIVFVATTEVYYRRHISNNTSSLNKEDRVRSVILSWKMVDNAIKEKLRIANHPYVKQARNLIYNKIKNNFSSLVQEHQDFFSLKRSRVEEFFIKVSSRLQLLYLKKVKVNF
ncbi:glycosyl transferase family 2 [Pontibacter ummariensis]|uniref:Glycosyl transferase family 2 n=1 Tax=Pontibacter ummariensis TaxID=1610492 RepID=A0A239EIK0_9BACT|nr:glycosyltransferase family 2 protein [Pontibacter ummariensis]PRY13279.1 glycosyl transferase family 2 [Pontibacter ummariensis]SNS44447.1 Glycosyl transferase family 2 [Pontibacter ummariensis]